MPDPTTAASSIAVPVASATIRRFRLAFIAITRGAFASPPQTLDTPTGIRSKPAPRLARHRARSARNQASEKSAPPLSSAGMRCGASLFGNAQRCVAQAMAKPLTLHRIDDDRPQEGAVRVQFHCGCPDHFDFPFRNDHRRDMLVNAVEGKVLCLERRRTAGKSLASALESTIPASGSGSTTRATGWRAHDIQLTKRSLELFPVLFGRSDTGQCLDRGVQDRCTWGSERAPGSASTRHLGERRRVRPSEIRQVPRHGGLRQFQAVVEVADAHLVVPQQRENPQTCFVR